MSCFPTMLLNRTKLRYGTIMLEAYEKFIWLTGFGAIYLLWLKRSLSVHHDSDPEWT